MADDRNVIYTSFGSGIQFLNNAKIFLTYLDTFCTQSFKLPVTICYIGLANKDSNFDYLIFKILVALHNPKWEIHRMTKSDIKKGLILNCTIVFIDQGNYRYFLKTIKKYEFDKELSICYNNGIIVSGSYFGLVGLFKSGIIKSFNDYLEFKGLGVIPISDNGYKKEYENMHGKIIHYRNEELYDMY